jgi:hypothetical protein
MSSTPRPETQAWINFASNLDNQPDLLQDAGQEEHHMRCDEYCPGCEHCLPGGWACGRCDALMTEDDPDYGGLCQECAGEDMARAVDQVEEAAHV